MVSDSSTRDEIVTLEGDAAINLWLAGKEEWDAWVKENPNAGIDFKDTDFGKIKDKKNLKSVSFSGYKFPSGDRDVSFDGAHFGDGKVSFRDVKFGDGDVSFNAAQFGNGNVYFNEAEFGDGDVSFNAAQFGDGNVYFNEAGLGDGDILFVSLRKGKQNFHFTVCELSKCKLLDFSRSTFESFFDISGLKSPCALNLQGTKFSNPIDLDNVNITFLTEKHFFIFGSSEKLVGKTE